MLWICRPLVLLTLAHIPPSALRLPDSKIVTSKPCPTQCAAEETPVMPAPMMAILGLLRLAWGGGGWGENWEVLV